MADIGEKVYVATENTAQDILTALDGMPAVNVVEDINDLLDAGIGVSTIYGGNKIVVKSNISSYSVNGSGKVFFNTIKNNNNSNYTVTFTVDGVQGSWKIFSISNTQTYNISFPFSSSFSLDSVVGEYSMTVSLYVILD